MSVETEKDIIGLRKVGSLVSKTIKLMLSHVRPGITTKDLDYIARKYFESHGAKSAPEVTYNFPGATCISVNNEVAHGIPSHRILNNGDMINIDVSLELDGYFADSGYSMCLPEASPELENLCRTSKKILMNTIISLKAGNKINKIGQNIEAEAKSSGYNVIRNLAGHGTGRNLHEEPFDIINFKNPRDKRLLTNGMVIAVETFISTRSQYVVEANDGWTLRCSDNSYVAQFEHTLVITKNTPILLTA